MSRRNSRQAKARRRAERDRRQVTERGPKRRGSPEQDLRAAGVQAASPSAGPWEEHGSGLRSDVSVGLIATDPGEAGPGADEDLGNADPGDFGDLDPEDADLQAVLAEQDLAEQDLAGEDLAEEDLTEADLAEADLSDDGDLADDVDGPEGPDGPEFPEGLPPGEPSADA